MEGCSFSGTDGEDISHMPVVAVEHRGQSFHNLPIEIRHHAQSEISGVVIHVDLRILRIRVANLGEEGVDAVVHIAMHGKVGQPCMGSI